MPTTAPAPTSTPSRTSAPEPMYALSPIAHPAGDPRAGAEGHAVREDVVVREDDGGHHRDVRADGHVGGEHRGRRAARSPARATPTVPRPRPGARAWRSAPGRVRAVARAPAGRAGRSGEATQAQTRGVGQLARHRGGADDLDPVHARAVTCPGRRPGSRPRASAASTSLIASIELERLAREAAGADDQQRLRRHALTAAIWVSRQAITWSCCSSVSPANSGSISESSRRRLGVRQRRRRRRRRPARWWIAITPRRVGTPSSSSRRISSLRSIGASGGERHRVGLPGALGVLGLVRRLEARRSPRSPSV